MRVERSAQAQGVGKPGQKEVQADVVTQHIHRRPQHSREARIINALQNIQPLMGLAYCKGPDGEQLEFNKVTGNATRDFDQALRVYLDGGTNPIW